MARVTRLPINSERHKDRRRLHLREIADDPQAPLDSVGATLRAARLNRGVDADHVAQALKMRKDHVEAIEDNDFTRLPGRTYAIGFVRAYARWLGLDAEVMVQRFKEESAGREHDRITQLVFPDAPEEKHMPNGSLLVIAVVIAAIIYGAWYISVPERRPGAASAKADEAPVVVEALPERTTAEVPTGPAVSPLLVQPSSLLAEAPGTQVAAADVPVATGLAPIPAPADHAAAAPAIVPAPKPAPDAATPAIVPTDAAAAPAAPSTAVFGAANANARIVLRATQPTYLLVRDGTNPDAKVTLIERTLNPGESYRVPDRAGLTLRTGNAGGLSVEIDGKLMGPVGKSGEVLNNVPVDPSYFLEHIAAQ